MSSTTDHTIVLSTAVPFNVEGRVQEDYGSGTINPGYLIEYDTNEHLVAHATGTGWHQRMVAIENPFDDATATAAIDSPYLTADTVRYIYALPGDLLYMYLATGTAVRGRSRLVSNGDGTLRISTSGSADLIIVGVPHEDLVCATATRLRVRIV
jgi:hypothetical protein